MCRWRLLRTLPGRRNRPISAFPEKFGVWGCFALRFFLLPSLQTMNNSFLVLAPPEIPTPQASLKCSYVASVARWSVESPTGSYDNVPNAIFSLLKGHYNLRGAKPYSLRGVRSFVTAWGSQGCCAQPQASVVYRLAALPSRGGRLEALWVSLLLCYASEVESPEIWTTQQPSSLMILRGS